MKKIFIIVLILFTTLFPFTQKDSIKRSEATRKSQHGIDQVESVTDSITKPIKVEITNIPPKSFWGTVSPYLLIIIGALIGWFPNYLSQKKNIKYQISLQKEKDWIEKFDAITAKIIASLFSYYYTLNDFKNRTHSSTSLNASESKLNKYKEEIIVQLSALGLYLDLNNPFQKELQTFIQAIYYELISSSLANLDIKIPKQINEIYDKRKKIIKELNLINTNKQNEK